MIEVIEVSWFPYGAEEELLSQRIHGYLRMTNPNTLHGHFAL